MFLYYKILLNTRFLHLCCFFVVCSLLNTINKVIHCIYGTTTNITTAYPWNFYFLDKTFFFNWITQLAQKKWWAKKISKCEYCHRSYRVWTSTCSHSGQTDVLQRRSATLPVATSPVSCFPQSVVMRVIPLCKAVLAQSRDPALSILWDWIKGDSACLRKLWKSAKNM